MRWALAGLLILLLSATSLALDTVIVVSDNPADKAVATSVSLSFGGSILTVDWGSYSETAVLAAEKMAPSKLIIIGGIDAVSQKMESDLEKFSPIRIGGKDRYETSLRAADHFWGESTEVIIANGEDPASISAAEADAKAKKAPILFIHSQVLPSNIESYLTKCKCTSALVRTGARIDADAVRSQLTPLLAEVTVEPVPGSKPAPEKKGGAVVSGGGGGGIVSGGGGAPTGGGGGAAPTGGGSGGTDASTGGEGTGAGGTDTGAAAGGEDTGGTQPPPSQPSQSGIPVKDLPPSMW